MHTRCFFLVMIDANGLHGNISAALQRDSFLMVSAHKLLQNTFDLKSLLVLSAFSQIIFIDTPYNTHQNVLTYHMNLCVRGNWVLLRSTVSF